MPIPRLIPARTALLVVDVQERLMPTLEDPEALATNCGLLLHAAEVLGIPALVTEQYPKGLGPTVRTLRPHLDAHVPRIEKTRFSAYVPEVVALLDEKERSSVLVCGIEAHVCVLQTVLDVQAAGRQAFVATDAVSAGQRHQIAPALRRMEAAGAVPTGVLSALYELLADKQHPAFTRCLHLAKAVRPL